MSQNLCERSPEEVYDLLEQSQNAMECYSVVLFLVEGLVCVATSVMICKRHPCRNIPQFVQRQLILINLHWTGKVVQFSFKISLSFELTTSYGIGLIDTCSNNTKKMRALLRER